MEFEQYEKEITEMAEELLEKIKEYERARIILPVKYRQLKYDLKKFILL